MVNVKTAVFAGIAIIIGIIFLTIADNLTTQATLPYGAYDSFTIAAENGSTTLTNIPVVAASESCGGDGSSWTSGVEYNLVDSTGVLTLIGINASDGNCTYQFTQPSYIQTSATTRTVTSYIGTLFAIGILLIGVYLIRKRI